jgi:hypothetical protein
MRVMYFFIHLQEGYKTFHEGYAVAFKPLNRKVMSGNQCPLTGYLVYRWGLVGVVLVGR